MSIVVDVMNNLIRRKESSQMLFRHESMLHHIALAIGMGMVRGETGVVPPVPTISYPSLEVRVSATPNISALPAPLALSGAKLLAPALRIGDVFPALATKVCGGVSPPMSAIALSRTKPRRFLSPVFRVKRIVAVDTLKRQCGSFHAHIISREERYCEIAVKRLQQGVLALEVS